MDEKRQFFRIKNTGHIHANCGANSLEVIEISSKGIAIIKEVAQFPHGGLITLHIYDESIIVKFELLKVENQTMVLVFPQEADVKKLFLILKNLKDHHIFD